MRPHWGWGLAIGLGTAACGDDIPSVEAEQADPASAGAATVSTASDDAGAPEGSGGAPGGDTAGASGSTGPGTSTGAAVPESLRFIALGDSGEGNDNQIAVAEAAQTVCAERGCDFGMLLGDNFYDVGVTAADDPQFAEKFENIYDGLDFPFYIVLGNHDYGALANDWARGDHQIEYGKTNDKWVMPHFWYTFTSETGATQFFAVDTQRIMFYHQISEQRDWMSGELEASATPWKIGFGHHPYVSQGKHGNAGNYEGLEGLSGLNGTYVKEFMDDFVCGQLQVYISGHDHNRQSFDPVCGTYFFVSGAAAKTTSFVNREDNPLMWGDDQKPGFLWAEIEGDTFSAAFFDLDANLDHEMTFTL